METSTTTEQAVLSREDMDRIAKQHGCTINVQPRKTRESYINLRYQKAPVYLGVLSTLEKLSDEEFAARVVEKLEKEYK